MIPFSDRLASLKDGVIAFIKDRVDRMGVYDEDMNIATMKIAPPLYFVERTVFGQTIPPMKLEHLDVHMLCIIADKILLKPLDNAKLPDNQG